MYILIFCSYALHGVNFITGLFQEVLKALLSINMCISMMYICLKTTSFRVISSALTWKIPWTEEAGGLQSMGLQRVGDD